MSTDRSRRADLIARLEVARTEPTVDLEGLADGFLATEPKPKRALPALTTLPWGGWLEFFGWLWIGSGLMACVFAIASHSGVVAGNANAPGWGFTGQWAWVCFFIACAAFIKWLMIGSARGWFRGW